MENHPIPQDITGFQFKLIGDMTIKQFAYLAGGAILGWISFILPIFILIKLPMVLIFGGLGAAAAFLPIEGRPFDTMVSNYFKALLSPTQYIYQKIGGHIWFPDPPQIHKTSQEPVIRTGEDSSQRLKEFLKTLPQKPKDKLDEKEMNFLNSLASLSSSPPAVPILREENVYQKFIPDRHLENNPQEIKPKDQEKPQAKETKPEKTAQEIERELEEAKMAEKLQAGSAAYNSAHQKVLDLEKLLSDTQSQKQVLENNPQEIKPKDQEKPETKEIKLEKTAQDLERELEEAKMAEKIQAGSAAYNTAHQKVLDLEKLLSDTQSQKQVLENQILELRKKIDMQNQKVFTPATIASIPKQETQSVRKVPKSMGKSVGLPFMPDVANLIMGIIKDPRDNPLPNILVEVKDENGNPVRAFKTNVLGQFVSATPLGNGTYTVSFEDPKAQNKFDAVEIKATGGALMPLEVISVDSREELRRSLFSARS